jgi:phage-related protein
MDMDVTARFRADISDMQSKMKTISRDLDGIRKDTDKAGKGFTVLKGAIGTALGGAAIGAIYKGAAAIKSFAVGSVDAAVEARKADERIAQIAESMGVLDTAMGGSTQRVRDFATELQSNTGVSDETIKQGQALLLTFKNIAGSAGETGGMFDRATVAAVDLAAAGFGSVEGNAKQLGKALQDPIKGISALTRSGVTFTNSEKEKIKALVESGNTLQAQTLIMNAVEQQVGGTAAATMTAGDKMRVAFDEFQETVGMAVLPMIEKVQTFIAERIVPALQSFVGYLQANVFPVVQTVFTFLAQVVMDAYTRFQQLYQAILPIAPLFIPITAGILGMVAAYKLLTAGQTAIKSMGVAIDALKAKQIALNAAVLANPYVFVGALIVGALAAMAAAFKMVYDRSEVLREAVSDVIDTFKTIASTVIGEVVAAFSSLFGSQKKVGGGMQGFGDILQKIADVAGPILAKALEYVGTYLKVIGNVARVAVKGFEIFATIVKMVANVARVVFVAAFQKVTSVLSSLMDKLGPIGAAVKRVASAIGSAFSNIPALISGAIRSAVGFVEGLINKAIDAINFLIRAYNKIPFVDGVSEIAAFSFGSFESGTAAVKDLSGTMGGLESQMVNAGKAVDNVSKKQKELKDTLDDTVTSSGAAGKAEDKRAEKIKKQTEALRENLKAARDAYGAIRGLTEGRFGEQSQILKAFGTEGDISSTIGMYDQLDAALNDYYTQLMKAPGLSKKVTKSLEAERDAQRGTLKDAAQTQIDLFRQRAKIQKDLQDLETSYAATTASIGARFDALDKQADDAIKSIESKWAGIIPGLESALAKASEAYEAENKVLGDLVNQRRSFLDQIASSFRGFVNQLSFGDGAGGGDIRAQLQSRLEAVREFAQNIRTLVQRGLDPTLVQEFVSAGVSGAGQAAAALVSAGQDEISAINEVQSGLASEIAAFGTFGAEQWYNAGIAQQEAIVAPLATAAQQAQMALDLANSARDSELASARAHAEQLKLDRQAAMDQAKLDYEKQKADLEIQMAATNLAIQAGADELQAKFTALQTTLPTQLRTIGRQAINGLIKGLTDKEPALIAKARELGQAVKEALEAALRISSPSKVTQKIGVQVAQGLSEGMGRGENLVSRSAGDLGVGAVPPIMPNSGGAGNVTVNNKYEIRVESLAGDKRQIGREVVEAIKAFERSSGPVYQPASL